MKYLKRFEIFKLILESELKHSENLAKQLYELYQKDITEIDELSQKEDKVLKSENLQNYPNHTLKVQASEIIFDKFKIQLGAIILQKCSETDFSMKELFFKKGEGTFIDNLKESITQKKLTDSLSEYLKKCLIQLNFRPFYTEPSKEFGVKFGSLAPYTLAKKAFINKRVMLTISLKLNLSEYEQIRLEVKDTIRHELQHLSQIINTICLGVGEFFIKNIDKIHEMKFYDEITKVYEKSVENVKVGTAKTFTGLKQNQKGDENSLKKALQKVINKDAKDGLTTEEQDLVKNLEYLGDDSEYKPWMSDKADYWYKLALKVGAEIKNDDETLQLTGKENLKKRLEYFKKHGSSKKITSETGIDAETTFIVNYAFEEDKELKLLKKLRKETYTDFYKYIRKKFEST